MVQSLLGDDDPAPRFKEQPYQAHLTALHEYIQVFGERRPTYMENRACFSVTLIVHTKFRRRFSVALYGIAELQTEILRV